MKKLITCGIAAALCAAALSPRAFAVDITEYGSLCADNAEQLAEKFHDSGLDRLNSTVDPNTIMPIYYTDIYDFAATGKLELTPENSDGDRWYVADFVDSSGEFTGIVEFEESRTGELSLNSYAPKYSDVLNRQQCSSVAFNLHS